MPHSIGQKLKAMMVPHPSHMRFNVAISTGMATQTWDMLVMLAELHRNEEHKTAFYHLRTC